MPIRFNKKEQKQLRKKLRSEMPKSERILWDRLRGNQIGYKFRRQHGIGRYIVDFYCPSVKVVVEIDGLSHEDNYEHDMFRQEYIESLGIRVLRFNTEEVFNNLDYVVHAIYQVCAAKEK